MFIPVYALIIVCLIMLISWGLLFLTSGKLETLQYRYDQRRRRLVTLGRKLQTLREHSESLEKLLDEATSPSTGTEDTTAFDEHVQQAFDLFSSDQGEQPDITMITHAQRPAIFGGA